MNRQELEARVTEIVGEALEKRPEDVQLHSSLIDDLGAESIDFLDIVFRVEHAFGLKISDQEIWSGEFDLVKAGPEEREAAIQVLKERMPEFRWDRFSGGIAERDFPRLITVRTIVDYLERTLRGKEGEAS